MFHCQDTQASAITGACCWLRRRVGDQDPEADWTAIAADVY